MRQRGVLDVHGRGRLAQTSELVTERTDLMTETVLLKNGAEEHKAFVSVAMMTLTTLIDDVPIAFYELVMACRDRNHQLFGNTSDILKARKLYPIHDSVRNVVLSAVNGEGIEMTLGSPLVDQ
jgi:hypothetical protein